MNSITVSVNYDDLLALTLAGNRHHFQIVVVVTSKDDHQTRLVAEQLGCPTYLSEGFHANGASFNKGLAIEEALSALSWNGWICHFDADIVLPVKMDFTNIEPGNLYTACRRLCRDPSDYHGQQDWSGFPLVPEKDPFDCGAVQFFHTDDPVLTTRPWYPTEWKHAGVSDTVFNAKWPANKRHYLPFEVLHLGEPYVNWHGRQTRRLDGTILEGAAEARKAMKLMYAARRKRGYELEKLP